MPHLTDPTTSPAPAPPPKQTEQERDERRPREEKPRRRHPFLRFLLRTFIVIVVLLIILAIAIQAVLMTDLPRKVALPIVEKALGLRIEASSLSTGWLGHTTLHDVKVSLPLA